jgi:hypothetical protein
LKVAIKEIVRLLKVSRNTVRRVLRAEHPKFGYERAVQPRLLLGYIAYIVSEGTEVPHNKQLQRTVKTNRGRAAGAPFHYAPTARWTAQHAAADLRR